MIARNKEYFTLKIKEIYSGEYVPEINHALTGWDFGPEYIMKYYDTLDEKEKIIFRETVKDMFIEGDKEWRWMLLDICERLRIKEITPIVLKYGQEYLDNNFKFEFNLESRFKFSPRVIVNFLKRVAIDDPKAYEYIRSAENSKNYQRGY